MDNNEEKNEMMNSPEISSPTMNMGDAGKKKNNIPKIIIIILVILAVVIGAVLLMKSNLFASNSEKFTKLMTTDQKVLEILKDSQNEKQINTSFKVDFDRIANELGQKQQQKIGDFQINNKHINTNDDFTNITEVKMSSIDKTLKLQIAKTGNLIGFNIPDITDQFITVDLDDIEGLFNNLKKLGLYNESNNKENNTIDKQESEKIKKAVEKYAKIFMKEADPYIQKISDVEVSMDGSVDKATRYQLDLTEDSLNKILLPVLKEFAKNDDDLKLYMELYAAEYDINELKKLLNSSIEELEESIKKNELDKENVLSVKLYEKNGKNIATVFEVEGSTIGFYVFEDGNDYKLVFDMDGKDVQLRIRWELKSSNNKKEGKLGLRGNIDNERVDITLLEYEQEVLNKAENELIKVNKENSVLLNTATQEELEKMMEKISKNIEGITNIAMPEQILPNPMEQQEVVDMSNDKIDLDNHVVIPVKSELKDGYLKKTLDLMNKVETGMTEEEVVQAIGKPNREVNGSNSKSLYYSTKVDNYDINLMHVFIYNGKVSNVSTDIMSSDFYKIYIGKELNAQLDDIEKALQNVKEGMTLSEVENILGTAYFNNSKDGKSSFISYTWYDAKEHHVNISFTDGKVSYIGFVW